MHAIQINLTIAWLWVFMGFVSGSMIGFGFRFFEDDWQGGYASIKRRLYRLGHISFFGLGLINFMFYFTADAVDLGRLHGVSSWAFVVGAITMPTCCFLMANRPRLKPLFYIPSISLLIGGAFTLWGILIR